MSGNLCSICNRPRWECEHSFEQEFERATAERDALAGKVGRLATVTRSLLLVAESLASEDSVRDTLSCFAIAPLFYERMALVRAELSKKETPSTKETR